MGEKIFAGNLKTGDVFINLTGRKVTVVKIETLIIHTGENSIKIELKITTLFNGNNTMSVYNIDQEVYLLVRQENIEKKLELCSV